MIILLHFLIRTKALNLHDSECINDGECSNTKYKIFYQITVNVYIDLKIHRSTWVTFLVQRCFTKCYKAHFLFIHSTLAQIFSNIFCYRLWVKKNKHSQKVLLCFILHWRTLIFEWNIFQLKLWKGTTRCARANGPKLCEESKLVKLIKECSKLSKNFATMLLLLPRKLQFQLKRL